MGETRSFISIEFPSEIIKEVVRVQELLKNLKFTGKLTEQENLHLTLKFLGNVEDEKLGLVKERLSNIKFPEIKSSLGEIGTFSYRGMPRIVWIKVKGKVFELQKEVVPVNRLTVESVGANGNGKNGH